MITSELGGGKLQPQLPAAPVVVTPEETVKPDPQIVAVPPSSAVVAAETIAAAEVKGGIMEQSRAAEASRVAGTVQIPSGIPTFGPIVKPLESSGVVLPLGHSTIAIETVTPLRQGKSKKVTIEYLIVLQMFQIHLLFCLLFQSGVQRWFTQRVLHCYLM